MNHVEPIITQGIVSRCSEKLDARLAIGFAMAGARPSGLVAELGLAASARRAAVLDRALVAGGGISRGATLLLGFEATTTLARDRDA